MRRLVSRHLFINVLIGSSLAQDGHYNVGRSDSKFS
jgi:hypothetical protein